MSGPPPFGVVFCLSGRIEVSAVSAQREKHSPLRIGNRRHNFATPPPDERPRDANRRMADSGAEVLNEMVLRP